MNDPYEYCPSEPTIEERLEYVEQLLDQVWYYLQKKDNLGQCVHCNHIMPKLQLCHIHCADYYCAHCLHLGMQKHLVGKYDFEPEARKHIAEWLYLRGGHNLLKSSYNKDCYEYVWPVIKGMIAPELEQAARRMR